mmetsp:Transcript_17700/g.41124  ORF Transcript_17700/g.41124 Transcript_17700/m.41124 type:complete len:189 (+) Transcript_17700:1755-2321(+)
MPMETMASHTAMLAIWDPSSCIIVMLNRKRMITHTTKPSEVMGKRMSAIRKLPSILQLVHAGNRVAMVFLSRRRSTDVMNMVRAKLTTRALPTPSVVSSSTSQIKNAIRMPIKMMPTPPRPSTARASRSCQAISAMAMLQQQQQQLLNAQCIQLCQLHINQQPPKVATTGIPGPLPNPSLQPLLHTET